MPLSLFLPPLTEGSWCCSFISHLFVLLLFLLWGSMGLGEFPTPTLQALLGRGLRGSEVPQPPSIPWSSRKCGLCT